MESKPGVSNMFLIWTSGRSISTQHILMAKTPRPPLETSKVKMMAHETWEIFGGLLLAAWLLPLLTKKLYGHVVRWECVTEIPWLVL
jgi:cellulose synthase/poly-beta-1,6-N-acetylglucosamine synthase-like glycosyltransferase